MSDKNELRAAAKLRRDGLEEEKRLRFSELIAARVRAMPVYKNSSQILLYLPLHSEVDTKFLAEAVRLDGKPVYAPSVDAKNKNMSFYRYEPGETLKTGAFGIKEPLSVSSRKADLGRPCLIICPCLSFDRLGHRLGYGAGYYDRFLAGPARAWKRAALAFSIQEEVQGLPAEEHDQAVQWIVTETETISTQG